MEILQSDSYPAPDIKVPPFSHILYYVLNVIILLVVIFVLAIPAVARIFRQTNAALSPEAQSVMHESFIPMYLETSGRIRLGEDFDVVLHLNSIVRAVESVDVVLDYNPEFVTYQPGAITGSTSFPRITDINMPYPGHLSFTALTVADQPFQGDDEVARVAFNAKSAGDTTILLQHDAGLSEASRVSSGGFDVLEKTISLQLEIGP